MLDQRNVQSPLPTLDGFGVQESNENALSREVDAIPGENGVQWVVLALGKMEPKRAMVKNKNKLAAQTQQ